MEGQLTIEIVVGKAYYNLNEPTVPSYKLHIGHEVFISYAFKVLNLSTELNLSKI